MKKSYAFFLLLLMVFIGLPLASASLSLEHLANQDFESGDVDWTLSETAEIGEWGQGFGTYSVQCSPPSYGQPQPYIEQNLIAPTRTENFTQANFYASGAADYRFHLYFDSGEEVFCYFDLPYGGLWAFCDATLPLQWFLGNGTTIGHNITLFELSSEYFEDASVTKIRIFRLFSAAITYIDNVLVYYYIWNPPAVDIGVPVEYYFRSDTYDTLGVSGYGLDADYTNSYITMNYSTPRFYSFRVYLCSSDSVSTELTYGYYSACFNLTGDEGYGNYSTYWECPETIVLLGYQCLKVKLYTSTDYLDWANIADYVSPVLITKKIMLSTWYFTMYITESTGYGEYRFGNTAYRSGIDGILFSVPLESEVQLWRITNADYVGFILGNYIDVIGEAFYVLCLLGIAGVFYFRYKHFGIIVFFFSIFGGSGGLVWFLLPAWAATVASALIIIGTSFLVWRLIR